MTDLSVTEAAFTGFRVLRARPMIMVFWALLMILTGAAVIALILPAVRSLVALGEEPTPQAAISALSGLAPALSLVFLIGLAVSSVIAAAANRAVLRPDDAAFGYLRLGADELRQLVVRIAYALLTFAAITLVILVLVVSGAMSGGMGAAGGLTIFGACILAAGAAVYLGVRLSLASAQTFDEARINIFGSWALTKSRFWPMLGAYVLAAILTMLIGLVGGVIGQAALFFSLPDLFDPMTLTDPDGMSPEQLLSMLSLESLLSIGVIIYLLVNLVVQAVSIIVMRTAPADIYRQLSASSDVAAAF